MKTPSNSIISLRSVRLATALLTAVVFGLISPGAALHAQSTAEPVATVAIAKAVVYTSGDTYAEFTLNLDAAATSDLTLVYSLKGTAVNGSDYDFLKGTKKIKAGKTSANIKIVPMSDLNGAAKRGVKLVLESGSGYTVGSPASGKVQIEQGHLIILP